MTEEQGTSSREIIDSVSESMRSALGPVGSISVDDVFREPVQSGDVVVIVAAAITKGGGYGYGFGLEGETRGAGIGGGSGGGAGGEGRPVAVIEITPAGTRVKPIIDFTRVGLTLLAGAFGIWRFSRRHR